MAAGASSSSEVLLGLTGLAWSLDHQSVLASGCPQSQLVKGDDFTWQQKFAQILISVSLDTTGMKHFDLVHNLMRIPRPTASVTRLNVEEAW